jgi:rod shape-determining protein MreD
MWRRNLFIIFLLYLSAGLQLGLFNNFFWLSQFNLFLVVLVFFVNLSSFSAALIFAFGSGLLLDIFSSLPFGTYLTTLGLTALVLEFLFFNFFTNRSFYSLLMLAVLAVVAYQVVFLAVAGVLYFAGWSDFFVHHNYWLPATGQLFITLMAVTLIFWFINRQSKSFKPTFLRP